MDTGRGDTAPTFSGLHVYLHFTWDVCLPPSPVEFSSLRPSHKVSRTWLLGMHPGSHPLRPGLACLFTVLGRIPLPAFSSQGAPPSLLCVFIFLIAYYSSNKQYCLSNIAQAIFLFFSLFSLGGGQSVQRAILIWPRDVCGPDILCPCLPKSSGHGWLAVAWGPSWFHCSTWSEMLCAGWRCGGVKVLPLLGGLACKVCLQHLSIISL
jgi:hypothetical protein